MKRLAVVVLVTVVAGVALATWGGAASAREANEAAEKLPALPSNIKERGRFNIGIKCDSPPFGYIDVRGRNAGFDVEIARWFSRFAFGKSTPRELHVRDDARPRAGAHDRPCGHGHRDLHLHAGPGHADRLLARLLQGHGPVPRPEQRTEQLPADDRRKDDRDDQRLHLRPLGEELLQGHEARRDGQLHERASRVP